MASYTDLIPQFNPYIQQLPVEAMVQVGMEKQRRYDEGVQKIQQNIDNVAGLDVIRDVDKAYLQSKLNELGSNLKTVAAGDFSNYQLVNSVGGMARQIGKDKGIQNAVSSTAKYRKELASRDLYKKEGKTAVQNDWDFNSKANQWLNSTNLDDSFNAVYTPFTDVKKKAMEAIKALHPNLQAYDIPFEVVDGKVNTKAIADAMQRYKVEGIDESQIAQAISASLSPEDINQLSIDANFQFRDVNEDGLIDYARRSYDAQRKEAEATLARLKEKRGVISDPNEYEKIDSRIQYFEKLLGEDGNPSILNSNLESQLALAKSNPGAVKLSIYKDGFIKEFANAFSWKNQEMSYVTSPLKEQQNWVVEQRRKAYEFNEKIKIDRAQLDLERDRVKLAAEANALKRVELYGDPAAADWTSLGNPTDNILKSEELYATHVTAVDDAIKGDTQRLQTKYTPAQINEMLADWQQAQGVVSKATKVKPDAINLIRNIAKNTNYLKSLNTLETNLKNDADKEAGVDQVISSVLANKKPVTFATTAGNKITLSPRDLLEISNAWKTQTVPSGEGVTEQDYIDESGLNSTQKQAVREIYSHLSKTSPVTRESMRSILKGYTPDANKLKDAYNKSKEIYTQKLAPLAQQFVPQIKAVAVGKDGAPPPVIISRLSQLLTAADEKGIAGDENFSLEKASEMLLDKNAKDTRVFIYQNGDDYQVHLKSDQNPKERQVLKLSKTDIARNFGSGYVNDKSQESIRLNLGRGNTNLSGDPTQAILQKQFGDFPGINKLQVTADLNQDLSDPELFTVMLNIKKKNGRYQNFELKGLNGEQRVGFDQGIRNLNSLTDEVLIKRLQQEYPNFDFSQLDY